MKNYVSNLFDFLIKKIRNPEAIQDPPCDWIPISHSIYFWGKSIGKEVYYNAGKNIFEYEYSKLLQLYIINAENIEDFFSKFEKLFKFLAEDISITFTKINESKFEIVISFPNNLKVPNNNIIDNFSMFFLGILDASFKKVSIEKYNYMIDLISFYEAKITIFNLNIPENLFCKLNTDLYKDLEGYFKYIYTKKKELEEKDVWLEGYYVSLEASNNEIKDYLQKVEDLNKRLQEQNLILEEKVKERTRKLELTNASLERANKDLKEKNEKLFKDLESARKIQINLLPKYFPPNIKSYIFTHLYEPCDKLGGDFYDIFLIDETHVGFYMADVSGHGVPAALITIFVRDYFRKNIKLITSENSYIINKPSTILKGLNDEIIKENFDQHVTAFLGILDFVKDELIWSSGGHQAFPIYINKSNKEKILKVKNYAVGWFEDSNYEDYYLKFKKGDKLLLYTDGIIESYNKKGECFGLERLIDFIKNDNIRNFNKLLETIKSYRNNDEQPDDISLLLVEKN